MKRSKFNLVWMLLIAVFTFASCSKDDDKTPNLVEDGAYIIGTAAPTTSLSLKAMMSSGMVEGDGYAAVAREGMYEKFLYLTSSSEGFRFVVKAGTEEITYGLATSTSGTMNLTGTDDQIIAVVDSGAIVVDGGNITVATDGFYHVVFDMTTMGYYIIPVENWNIKIADDLEMTQVSLTATTAKWEKTGVELRKGSFKFRYDKGWKVLAHEFTIFTNFGGTKDALAIGGGNIPIALADEGIYTITLNWNLTDGFTTTLVKTGEVVPVDPATFVWSLIGNAFYAADGVTVADWNYDIDLPYLSKSGNVYTYKVNSVELLAGGSFKIRKDHAWAGGDFGFSGTTIAGDVANFTDDGGNIKVTATKTYSVTFDLDWANDTRTLTFTPITK